MGGRALEERAPGGYTCQGGWWGEAWGRKAQRSGSPCGPTLCLGPCDGLPGVSVTPLFPAPPAVSGLQHPGYRPDLSHAEHVPKDQDSWRGRQLSCPQPQSLLPHGGSQGIWRGNGLHLEVGGGWWRLCPQGPPQTVQGAGQQPPGTVTL